MNPGYYLVLCTCPNKKVAKKIARMLVEEQLAACVNMMGKVQSMYYWQGKVEQSTEQQLLIKTRKSSYIQLEQCIKKIHPYEVPEIIAIPIVAGSKDYLDWMDGSQLKL